MRITTVVLYGMMLTVSGKLAHAQGGTPAKSEPAKSELSKSEKICFDPDDVQNFKYQKRNTMVVKTHRKESYVLTLSGVCPDLDSANGIGFTDVFAGDICSNTRASIVYNGMSFGPQKCRIANIERAPAE